jgi:uncharacterized damage-inducible protein DinB
MQQPGNLNEVALGALRKRIADVLPAQIRECVEQLNEEQLWWRPNEQANSVGNLVLHLSGSMRHYLSRNIGGIDYERDRAAEFSERGPLPKQQVLSIFDETVRQAEQVLNNFDTSRFLDGTDEPGYHATLFEQLLGVLTHLATHGGQIIFATKMLKEGSLDELWIRAHKTGAHKK